MTKLEQYAAEEAKEKDHKMSKSEILIALRSGKKRLDKKKK